MEKLHYLLRQSTGGKHVSQRGKLIFRIKLAVVGLMRLQILSHRNSEGILHKDKKLTCVEVAESVGISHGSAHEIITRHLKMRRIAARWVPHFLTRDLMQKRVRLAEDHINRHEKEGETFLNSIVAIDKTWLRSYEPELKTQSTEWHSPASPRPAKFRRKQGNLKQLAIFAYDNSGLLTTDYVLVGETINGEYYSNFLRKKNATSYA